MRRAGLADRLHAGLLGCGPGLRRRRYRRRSLLAVVLGWPWLTRPGAPGRPICWSGAAGLAVVPRLLALVFVLTSSAGRSFCRGGGAHEVRRKKLAALLSVRHGLAPGGLEALLEDDEQMALHLQRFLAEHQVPYPLPLYDCARPLPVRRARRRWTCWPAPCSQSVGKGHDNELFVLLADLLELDDRAGAAAAGGARGAWPGTIRS